ncbi:MAG: POTRA domain-containing protein [Bryobacteraceae bacterium]
MSPCRSLLLLATLLPQALPQANNTDPAFPIHSLQVTGSKLYPAAALAKLTGLTPGTKLAESQLEPELDKAQKRLLASGALSNVSYRYGPSGKGGFDIAFEVTDFEQRIPYRFEGLDIDETKARAFLKQKEPLFDDRIPASEAMVERFRSLVAEFASAAVKSKVESDRDGQLFALFLPAAGLPSVAEISFTGNEALTTTALRNAIHGVAVGTIYREDTFREILRTSILPLYENRGRLRVKFPKIEAKPVEGSDVRGLAVSVTIDEGPSFTIGRVLVTGTPANDDIAGASGLKPGNVANFEEIREGQRRVHAAIKRGGFMKVSSKIEPKIDDKAKEADILYRVAMGPRYSFARMETRGLDLHGEHEVKRLWTMKPGEPFNAEYPGLFLTRLREDGIFDNLQNTKAVLDTNEDNLTVTVTLVFNEKREKAPAAR